MMPFASQGQHTLDAVVALAAAWLLTLPLAWEREVKGSVHVGWRTLPLVSVGTCAYLLLGRYLYEGGIYDVDGQARALRAVMTGVGFIGGGAIFKSSARADDVAGITTAASVWTTGAIGASVAHGHYVVAALLALSSLLVIQATGRLIARVR